MTNESGSSQSSQQEAAAWVRTELESADFGDERLHKRALRILERFWAHPQWSIPTAMGCWAETKATYRFITNPRVTAERILGPHKEATASRMKEHPVVLAVQDTTELNYTSHEALEDIGTIGSSRTLLGMLVHSTIAFTPERLPVGIIDQHTWVRPVEEFGKKASRAQRPIEEKESFKWLLSVKTVEAIQQQLPGVQFVSVGDREADRTSCLRMRKDSRPGCSFGPAWTGVLRTKRIACGSTWKLSRRLKRLRWSFPSRSPRRCERPRLKSVLPR